MKVALLPLAQIELDEAFSWYEEQVIGLGYEFFNEFDTGMEGDYLLISTTSK